MVLVYSTGVTGASLTASNERRLARRAILWGFGVPFGDAHASSLQELSACEQLDKQLAATSDRSLKASTIR